MAMCSGGQKNIMNIAWIIIYSLVMEIRRFIKKGIYLFFRRVIRLKLKTMLSLSNTQQCQSEIFPVLAHFHFRPVIFQAM